MATTYDFLEVTLGESYLKFDGETPGYADGVGIEAKIEYKTYDFGVPLRRIGKAKIKLTFNADASLKEIRPLNLLMCLGLSEATFQDILGATHTVSNEAKTFSAENGGTLETVTLAHPALTSTPIVVTNSGGTVTYTIGEDYIVDTRKGRIYRNPDGIITAGQAVLVDYEYKELSYQQVNFAPDLLTTREIDVNIYHRKPTTGELIVIDCFKMRAGETSMAWNPQDWVSLPIKLMGFYMPERPNYSYGRIMWYLN